MTMPIHWDNIHRSMDRSASDAVIAVMVVSITVTVIIIVIISITVTVTIIVMIIIGSSDHPTAK